MGLTTTAVLDGFLITGGMANGDYPEFYGAGMHNYNSSPVVRNCLFQANSAASGQNGSYRDAGGAISNEGSSSPVLTNCSFQANGASFGGAIFNTGSSSLVLTNCSFQANGASFFGGAIHNTSSSSTVLTNCVVWGNGGASTFYNDDGSGASIITRYSFFESSVTGYTSGPGNLTATTSPFASSTDTRLACGSVAINAGDPATTTAIVGTIDLAGNPRFYVGGRIDMGAYEIQGPSVSPTRFYVRAGATGANTGFSWTDAFTDLQSALNYFCSGSDLTEIWVATGVYRPTATTNRSLSLAMKNGIAIYGGFAGSETALSQRVLTSPSSSTLSGNIGDPATTADNSYHVISNPVGLTTTAVLDGFVITGGMANGSVSPDGQGGGMCNNGNGTGNSCSPLIRNCLFQANSATSGGAIYNAGYSGGSSSTLIRNCLFQANSATFGGAIYNAGYSYGSSSPSLANCSFQANSATNQGGAIFNDGSIGGSSSPSLTNCSFQANSATNQGGAMYNVSFQGSSSPSLTNCVVWGNGGAKTFSNNQGAFITTRYSFFESSVTGYNAGTGNLTATTSPFASSTDTRLAAGSVAINAGDPATTTATVGNIDLAGDLRFAGGQIDMGAYEYGSCSVLVATVKAGSWADPTVWSCGTVPTSTNVVQVNHVVSLGQNYVAQVRTVRYGVGGRIIYQTGGRLRLGL